MYLPGTLLGADITSFGQKSAYKLFREDGKKVKYEKMINAAAKADVVLFGELHNNPISHWLQLELTRDLFESSNKELVLGAEVIEADNQLILDEFLESLISQERFEVEARLWKNYNTDYKPLVMFAKDNDLDFVATNIPRRYANSVFKQGISVLDSLNEMAKSYIAPLPLEYDTSLNCYSRLISGSPMGGHGGIHLADAEAIKDATMAHFLLKNWSEGQLFIHFNGAYHSDHFESMNWFLRRANPELKIVTISTVSQDTIEELGEKERGKAAFIICVPSSMTTTY